MNHERPIGPRDMYCARCGSRMYLAKKEGFGFSEYSGKQRYMLTYLCSSPQKGMIKKIFGRHGRHSITRYFIVEGDAYHTE
jgi:hypothetical protein